jgi:uncharacterized membrane protein YfcA
MKAIVMNPREAITLFALGLCIAAMGIYVGEADDDAPGAAVLGMLLMVVAVVLGVTAARRPSDSKLLRNWQFARHGHGTRSNGTGPITSTSRIPHVLR